MSELKAIADLYRHMEWADALLWAAALASDNARTDAKVKAYFTHLHMVQRAFLCIWRHETLDLQLPEFADPASVMQWGRRYYEDLWPYLEGLSGGMLTEPMPMPWAARVIERLGRSPETTTIGETALQVVLHSQYHRGQINAQLRQVGAEPPLVDYIAWVWLGRQAAAWPESR